MSFSRSGEYRLPGPFKLAVGNALLNLSTLAPRYVRNRFLGRRSSYQVFDDSAMLNDEQGLSINKWKAMQMPSDMRGKSVLDIGCSEGFFCHMCAASGAAPVVGIDSGLGRLLCGRFNAMNDGFTISYRMDIFPSSRLSRKFDYVLCLSVLHHFFKKKDIWKILIQEEFGEDLAVLRQNMTRLRALTADGGKCVIEMPYEYDDVSERQEVDFHRFCMELTNAGFTSARCLGTWEHNKKYADRKDRVIYVAEAK